MSPTLYTMGYGSWKDTKSRMKRMTRAMKDAGITMLVDIRHSPCASDPNPTGNYSAKAWNLQVRGGIVEELRTLGIQYRWIVELGNPQKRDPQMAVLREHLASGDPQWPVNRGLLLLRDLVAAPGQRCCMLCACADYASCHRRVIAEAYSAKFHQQQLSIIDLA
jgi:hypothetical protein